MSLLNLTANERQSFIPTSAKSGSEIWSSRRSAFALGLLAFTAILSSNALAKCGPLLANPIHHQLFVDYSVSVPDTPIVSQCGGTCHLESSVSFLENMAQIPLASQYNLIQYMKEQATEILKEENLRKAKVKDGYIDIFPGKSIRATLLSIEKQGIVPQDKFQFRGEFLAWLAEIRKSLRKDYPRLRSEWTDMDTLRLYVGVLLKTAKDNIEQGKPAEFRGMPIEQALKKIFAGALAGVEVNPLQEFKRLLPGRKAITEWVNDLGFLLTLAKAINAYDRLFYRSSFKFHTAPQAHELIESKIRQSLDAQKSILLGFTKADDMIDLDGTLSLKLPLSRIRSDRKDNPESYTEHAVVIQGYKTDGNGRLQWLLIRESQGDGAYDNGYLHMHIDYLWAFATEMYFY